MTEDTIWFSDESYRYQKRVYHFEKTCRYRGVIIRHDNLVEEKWHQRQMYIIVKVCNVNIWFRPCTNCDNIQRRRRLKEGRK